MLCVFNSLQFEEGKCEHRTKNHGMCTKPENTEAGKTHTSGEKNQGLFFQEGS